MKPAVNLISLSTMAFFFAVCSCVVHKRCHKDVVIQCSGLKQEV